MMASVQHVGSRKVMQEDISGSAHLALTADHIRAVGLHAMRKCCHSGRHISHTSEQVLDTLDMRSGCRLNLSWHGRSGEQFQELAIVDAACCCSHSQVSLLALTCLAPVITA